MNDTSQKYFTTGEFAKLCKVNKQTLFYYDQIGLLTPVFKNEKGYRYYSIRQIELFTVIDLLKDLGMSLNDIRQYVENKSPEKFLSIMYQQKEKVAKQRRELEMKEKMIDAKIEVMINAAHIDFDQIKLEKLPEQTFYLSKNIENISDDEFFEALVDFIDELYESQLDTGYPIGSITTREQIQKGDFTNYSYLYMQQPNPKEGYPYFKTEGGYYLIGYHVGSEKASYHTYERLLSEADRLDLLVGDYILEEFIYDTVVKNSEEQYVIKIMVQVIPKSK
ncbi:MerR family transcriptional regulator [Piscibacillus halophilus]|uniref:DNA-binding transcriptional regulator, MerR family n=1 Tax=Piscibacillus halophilus TaxID=571933 RepID=A0A1H9HIZ2_9BACI|nr:MerR family transcriptional regulator [Piscibacillus halophilus]SEQ62303.1 DNA-binding transcriptional regulator, MerR family [Piscibacillus halophilus]